MPETQQEILRKLTLEQRQALPRQRDAAIDNIDVENRKVTLSFASEAPVLDYWGDAEILRCNDQAADITRFTNGVMPVLYNHNRNEVIGKPTRIWFENARAYAEIQFEAERWEVYEISIVSMPADTTVGVGRSLNIDDILKILNNGSKRAEESGGTNMEDNTLNKTEDQQRQTPEPAPVVPPAAPAVNTEEERAAAKKEERERFTAISELCRQFDIDREMELRFITGGKSIDEVRAAVLEEIAKRNKPTTVTASVIVTEDEQDKKRALYRDAILVRGGVPIANPVEGSEKLRHMSMDMIARQMMLDKGERDALTMGQEELFKRTMTTGLLPTLFSDITEVSLREGYQAADSTYDRWAYIGSVKDFREHKTVTIGLGEDPIEIPENGEFTEAVLRESASAVKVSTYGRSYSYTRKSFINDDLDVLTRIPYMLGRKYPLLINRLAYQALAAGTYTAKVNLGTAGAVSTKTIAEAMELLRKAKDPLSGEFLRIRPRYLVVPVSQEAVAAQFLRSTADPAANNSGVANIYQGALTLISDPELDNNSIDAWYVMGEPVGGEGVEVDFLRGNKTPFLDSRESFTTLGWSYRSYFDFGVTLRSTLGYVKNAGK